MAQMVYNALGQRVAKEAISKPLHQHYNLSGQYLGTTAYNSTGTLYQRFEWIYLDQTPIAQVRTNYGSNNNVSSRRQLIIHADHLGTPRAMTDTAKRLVWRWDGNAFGQATPNQNPDGDTISDILNLRFPGQYYDSEVGTNYNYYRDYDAVVGRYIESDPIGLAGGMNTYAYVNGNPILFTDRLGLYPGCHQISPGVWNCPDGGPGGGYNSGDNSVYPPTHNNARYNSCYSSCMNRETSDDITIMCSVAGSAAGGKLYTGVAVGAGCEALAKHARCQQECGKNEQCPQ